MVRFHVTFSLTTLFHGPLLSLLLLSFLDISSGKSSVLSSVHQKQSNEGVHEFSSLTKFSFPHYVSNEFRRNFHHSSVGGSRHTRNSKDRNFNGDGAGKVGNVGGSAKNVSRASKESGESEVIRVKDEFYWDNEFTHYNVGVLLVSGTGSSFDLEKCSPAVDMAIDTVNDIYLRPHKIMLHKVPGRLVSFLDF